MCHRRKDIDFFYLDEIYQIILHGRAKDICRQHLVLDDGPSLLCGSSTQFSPLNDQHIAKRGLFSFVYDVKDVTLLTEPKG